MITAKTKLLMVDIYMYGMDIGFLYKNNTPNNMTGFIFCAGVYFYIWTHWWIINAFPRETKN